jgi:hypothetical protein
MLINSKIRPHIRAAILGLLQALKKLLDEELPNIYMK